MPLLHFFRFLAFILVAAATNSAHADREFITIGTGDITGVYYPAGGAICRLLNKDRSRHDMRCAVESTPGSAYNLKALKKGELDLAIVQSDWHHHAVNGSSIFAGQGPDQSLRTLLHLHTEKIAVVARSDRDINEFTDLKGKKVNLGSPESGHRRTMDLILEYLAWSYQDFQIASELSASEMAESLCAGRIDAFIYVVGHPNASITEATTFCDSKLIPLPDTLIEGFVQRYPFFQPADIKGGLYRGNPESVSTLQLTASLVSTQSLPEHVALELVRTLHRNLKQFQEMHPALSSVSADQMFRNYPFLSPLHKGSQMFLQSLTP